MKTILTLIACTVIGATALHAQSASDLNVGVRSQLDWQKDTWNGKAWDGAKLHKLPDPPEHGKIYGILLIQPAQRVSNKLAKPVDEVALKNDLIRQLDSHGFTHAGPTRRPDILLTVIYGRAWLPNPYYSNTIDVDNIGPELQPNPFDANGPPNVGVDDVKIANRLRELGVEEKATRSDQEKLFIMIRAWKNPSGPKEKKEILWVATMLVDDPDHLDLNAIAKQMLEAGAPYFDKEIKSEEVEVMKPLRDGHVTVGTPEVVGPAKAK